METRILGNVSIHGSVRLAQNESGLPANPQIGTIVVKDQCIYAYIKIGGLETWYPFASKTNSYVHVQGLPALVWNINHALGTTDIWSQVKDEAGNIVQALVQAVDADNATITFTTPIIGTAVIVAPDTIDVPEVKATAINVANDSVIIDSSGVRVNGSYALTAANIEQYAQAAVRAETDTRIAEDNKLQTNINTEASTRASADAALQTAINSNIDQSVKTTATPQFAGVKLTGHIIPNSDVAYDLGSATKRFRDLYLSGSAIYLGEGKISYSSTNNEFNLLNPQSQAAKVSLSANTTDDLSEGTNRLYFTTARAQAVVDVEATARATADALLQDAIDTKQDFLGFTPENSANRGIANGYASLGSDGKVPAAQLPSYVDDVLEYATQGGFPTTGETAKIYIALDTNKTYRWSGSVYVEISPVAGNADSATKLATPRTISLSGDLTGSVSFDGTADVSISTNISAGAVTLGTDTSGNYIQSISTTAPLSGGAVGSAGTVISLALATGYGDTQNPFGSKNSNYVFAAPSGASGTPTFRALVSSDIPSLDAAKINSGTLAVAQGGTGTATLTGIVKGNGTGAFTSAIAGTDYVIPSGNITGNAATVTNGVYTNGNQTIDGTKTFSSVITSSVVSGTAPLSVVSNTLIQNLNADLLDGKHSTDFASTSHTHLYAGSTSAGGSANSVANSYTVAINGGTVEGSNLYTFDGSAAKGINFVAGSNISLTAASGTITIDSTAAGGLTVSDDTTTNATYYPTFVTATSGSAASAGVSSTKLTFNPSTGQLNARTFNSTSDRRAKENIRQITNALNTVERITGVEFTWRETGQTSYGYIAQDIEEVLPAVVSTNSDGDKSVNYDATIAILLEAIKELNTKVIALESRI